MILLSNFSAENPTWLIILFRIKISPCNSIKGPGPSDSLLPFSPYILWVHPIASFVLATLACLLLFSFKPGMLMPQGLSFLLLRIFPVLCPVFHMASSLFSIKISSSITFSMRPSLTNLYTKILSPTHFFSSFINIWHIYIYLFMFCLRSCTVNSLKAGNFLFPSLPYPWFLKYYLACGKYLVIFVRWMTEFDLFYLYILKW